MKSRPAKRDKVSGSISVSLEVHLKGIEAAVAAMASVPAPVVESPPFEMGEADKIPEEFRFRIRVSETGSAYSFPLMLLLKSPRFVFSFYSHSAFHRKSLELVIPGTVTVRDFLKSIRDSGVPPRVSDIQIIAGTSLILYPELSVLIFDLDLIHIVESGNPFLSIE